MAAVMASPSPLRGFDFEFRSPARCSPSLDDSAADKELLEEVCSTSYSKVLQWRKERSQAVHGEAQRGVQDIVRDEEALENLKADLCAVKELTEAAREFGNEGVKLGEAVRQSMNEVAERNQEAHEAKEMLCKARDACLEAGRKQESKIQKQKQDTAKKMDGINDFLTRYSDALGLTISRVAPQTVRLAFTCIDEANPQREFCLTLGLCPETEVYTAFDCSPNVPEISHLLRRLNEDPFTKTSVPAFMCGLRAAFVASCR
eukprot:TRINITY_DN4663_c0_g1_i1.p1 TRINITY_DN4663_c0_g1~~TRINITY_DN4663_c0_g1_i1.p1  ORF type:complete len:280 (+),score=66.16 TRINITY_DN4663_c0_g1_i1:61-840(+)